MQSNGARVLVALGSIAVIVVLLIVFAGGDDEGETTTAAETTTTANADDASGGASEPVKPEKPKPEGPEFETIVVEGGEPKGGVRDLTYSKGEMVRLEVRSDVAENIHVHGYDVSKDVAAGGKARLSFPADIDGVFEIELENSAVELAQLTVKP